MRIFQFLVVLSVALLAGARFAHGASQAELTRSCEAETWQAELRIAEARKKPEFRNERGRQALTKADRWLLQARTHAAKGEPRHCLSAVQKSRAQL